MIRELFTLFIKLGVFAFGGPAAHTAMMNEEVVEKKKWFTQEEFLDLISFTNLIPGPNSTELAILIGYKQAGLLGLLVAGISFILPAVLIVLIFTIIFIHYETIPTMQNIMYGMLPVMIIIILMASIKMGKKSITSSENWIIMLISLGLLLLKLNEILVLIIAGLIKLAFKHKDKILSIEPFSSTLLFLTFLRIGAFLYGSGYVLISFVHSAFVEQLGWLTNAELVNLVMIGEITPGPLFTTATAIGYYLGGFTGSFLATLGIFIPSFTLIGLVYPLYEKLRKIPTIQIMISGISVASIAIMLNVVISLVLSMQMNVINIILLIIMFVVSYKYKVNNFVLILIGAVFGLLIL